MATSTPRKTGSILRLRRAHAFGDNQRQQMTPEERARADAITDSISATIKQRRQPSSPAISPTDSAVTNRGVFYVVIFAAVVAAHVVGFIAYQHHSNTKAEHARRVAQAEIDALEAARAIADREAERLRRSFAAAAVKPRNLAPPPPRPIEYNIYKETRPTPPPAHSPSPAESETPSPRDRLEEHKNVAQRYLARKKNVWITPASIEQVPGWEGRYRTQFELIRDPHKGMSSPTPRRYEVITEEKNGTITGVDATTKGY